jgi:hypothetical protein
MLFAGHDAHRRFDGSIDFDLYRRRAARRRRTEMRAFFAARTAIQLRLAIAVGILVVTFMSLPPVDAVEADVVHAHSHYLVVAPLRDPAAGFRRTAADLFGIVRLSGDGVRAPWPDHHL